MKIECERLIGINIDSILRCPECNSTNVSYPYDDNDESCSCHINPPCSKCESRYTHVCEDCGNEFYCEKD